MPNAHLFMQSPEATDQPELAPDVAESGGVPCADQPLALRIEVVLLTNDRPVTDQKLVEMLGGRESFVNFMESQVGSLKGMRFIQVRAGRILRVLPDTRPMQCLVEQLLELEYLIY